jgi:hypothetical protein
MFVNFCNIRNDWDILCFQGGVYLRKLTIGFVVICIAIGILFLLNNPKETTASIEDKNNETIDTISANAEMRSIVQNIIDEFKYFDDAEVAGDYGGIEIDYQNSITIPTSIDRQSSADTLANGIKKRVKKVLIELEERGVATKTGSYEIIVINSNGDINE